MALFKFSYFVLLLSLASAAIKDEQELYPVKQEPVDLHVNPDPQQPVQPAKVKAEPEIRIKIEPTTQVQQDVAVKTEPATPVQQTAPPTVKLEPSMPVQQASSLQLETRPVAPVQPATFFSPPEPTLSFNIEAMSSPVPSSYPKNSFSLDSLLMGELYGIFENDSNYVAEQVAEPKEDEVSKEEKGEDASKNFSEEKEALVPMMDVPEEKEDVVENEVAVTVNESKEISEEKKEVYSGNSEEASKDGDSSGQQVSRHRRIKRRAAGEIPAVHIQKKPRNSGPEVSELIPSNTSPVHEPVPPRLNRILRNRFLHNQPVKPVEEISKQPPVPPAPKSILRERKEVKAVNTSDNTNVFNFVDDNSIQISIFPHMDQRSIHCYSMEDEFPGFSNIQAFPDTKDTYHHHQANEGRIVVFNLTCTTSLEDLWYIFKDYGTIFDMTMVHPYDSNQFSFAFIEFEDPESAISASDDPRIFKLYGRSLGVDHCIKDFSRFSVYFHCVSSPDQKSLWSTKKVRQLLGDDCLFTNMRTDGHVKLIFRRPTSAQNAMNYFTEEGIRVYQHTAVKQRH